MTNATTTESTHQELVARRIALDDLNAEIAVQQRVLSDLITQVRIAESRLARRHIS